MYKEYIRKLRARIVGAESTGNYQMAAVLRSRLERAQRRSYRQKRR